MCVFWRTAARYFKCLIQSTIIVLRDIFFLTYMNILKLQHRLSSMVIVLKIPVFLCEIISTAITDKEMSPEWWRHQMKTFSALLAICAGNSPVTGVFPAQKPVTRSFDVFFDLRSNKRLSKQPWGWRFETPSYPYDVTIVWYKPGHGDWLPTINTLVMHLCDHYWPSLWFVVC